MVKSLTLVNRILTQDTMPQAILHKTWQTQTVTSQQLAIMTNDTYMFAMVQHWTNRKASNPWIDDLDGMCTYGFHGIVPNMSFVDHMFDLNMIWACRTLGQHTTTIHIPRTNTHAHIFSCHVHLRSGLRHHMSSHYSCFLQFHTIPTAPY